ncbi:hypothetical protein LCGC14_1518660 [marine sediment metagenome]|uniref:ParB/Sulfiredoxin domain-containing protein n=1 Tax=marine sediment metagenome TaxID=412755 RepID=A0A0F9M0D0_9ZZZZ
MATQLKLTWMDDLKAEHDLRALSVAFEIRTIPFPKIDLKESQYNGARLGDPIIPRLVEDYVTGMRNRDTFPRIVVHESKSGFVILGGNQRAAAMKKLIDLGELPKALKIEVYVVGTSDKLLLEIIARSGNVGHGGRSEKEERTAHAAYSVRRLGMRPKDAAKIFNLAESTITLNIRAEKQREELASAGVDLSAVGNSSVEPLSKIVDSGVKLKVAQLVSQHNPGGEKIRQVAGAIRKAKSQSARLAHVKNMEKELTEADHRSIPKRRNDNGQRKVPQRPRRDRIIRDLGKLADYLDFGMDGQGFASFGDFQIASAPDEATVRDLHKRIQFRMKMILGAKK